MNTVTRPIVLVFVRHYVPSFKSGGPVRSIANMVDQLSDKIQFKVVTSDRDALDRRSFQGICVDEWNDVGRALVYYSSGRLWRFYRIKSFLRTTDHHIIYLNSLFDYPYTLYLLVVRRISRVVRTPILIAPRGELNAGAMQIRRLKKIAFLLLAKITGLYKGVTWQATSVQEARDISRVFGVSASRVRMVANLPSLTSTSAESAHRAPAPDHVLRAVFLSRISPKKNLDYALRVLSKVHVPVHFDVYGPIRDREYWNRCKDLGQRLPAHISLEYKGSVHHSMVRSVLSDYDLFFLPTLGENYGHVVQESLSVGTPVLISNLTPWLDLDEHGVGWVRDLRDPEAFRQVIESIASQSHDDRAVQRAKTTEYGRSLAGDQARLNSNLRMFMDLIKRD